MNKRIVYFGIFIIFSMLILSAAFALDKTKNKWQSSDSISSSGGNLQEIINSNLLRDSLNSILDSSAPNVGHNLSEIWISVNGAEMTFKDAIQNLDKLCGDPNFNGVYTSAPDPNHLGTEIEITTPYDGVTKSLQEAIGDGSLVNVDGIWSDWSECDLQTGFETRTCDNPSKFCKGLDCVGNNQKVCGDLLTNSEHTDVQCVQEGGTVYDLPEGKICAFEPYCPEGWTIDFSFSSTVSRTCSYNYECNPNSCTTGGHTQFQHLPVEICDYTQWKSTSAGCTPPYCSSWGMCGKWYAKYPCCKGYSQNCWGASCDFRATLKCSATITEIGCY